MDDGPPPTKKARVPKVAKVKNKMPAEVQITAEQLLQEASSTKVERVAAAPRVKITDPGELADLQRKKRKEFEDNIRKNRSKMTNWTKYAAWEEAQKEYDRSRSVYERAVDVDHRNITVWLKYAEMEMRHKQINHARNVWDRAVTILPRANQFWYKYSYMEEMLGNIAGARQVFERWMEWEPDEQAWNSFIKMELRYKELDRARGIYERFVQIHPEVKNWIRYARFEEQNGYISNARNIFERAVEYFGEDHMEERLFISFAKFEENCREYERARTIYKYALDLIPKKDAEDLFKVYTHFEKRFGDRAGIEDVIISKRKFQYEEEVKANSMNYDAWFDYIRLVEAESMQEDVREVYERAIANIPPSQEKRFWRRYIYLWIYYALYEELVTKDIDRTRQVYQACLDIIPHRKFTFAKVWMMYAHFEVRQKDITAARKALGTAIGKCPKPKLFKSYIELELQLREFDRCRKLYEKYLEFNVANSSAWIKYTELETILGDTDRARGIFELAINQPLMDMPELLWKAYIDFETEQEEYDNCRKLFERLLERTQHVKVWLSYGKFEISTGSEEGNKKAREVFRQANKTLKAGSHTEERAMVLEAWRDFENEKGDAEGIAEVGKIMPKRVKKRRKVYQDDGSDAGWEEYWDYMFPDDVSSAPHLKLLEMARMWKQRKEMGVESSSEEEDNNDEEEREVQKEGEEGQEEGGEGQGDGEKEGGEKFDDRDTDYSSDSSEHDKR